MASLHTIAHIRSDFPEKFGIPRQSGLVKGLKASIVFTQEYRDPEALRGLESFSHIWLLWGFSKARQNTWSPTVRPPRLGGNTRMGVFATRSPYRPNSIGLSAVKIEKIELHTPDGPIIYVLGADMLDGTPIYDIKPYLPYADSHPAATAGFTGYTATAALLVRMDKRWDEYLSKEDINLINELLANDPRPSYQHDAGRIYGMTYKQYNIRFSVAGDILTVHDIQTLSGDSTDQNN